MKPGTVPLALGDLLVVLAFVGVGTYHHGATDPAYALYVAVPFVVGWFVVGPLAGAYANYPSLRNETFATLGTWAVAAVIGLALRSTGLFSGSAHPAFGFVMVVAGGAVFVAWRLVVVRVLYRVYLRYSR